MFSFNAFRIMNQFLSTSFATIYRVSIIFCIRSLTSFLPNVSAFSNSQKKRENANQFVIPLLLSFQRLAKFDFISYPFAKCLQVFRLLTGAFFLVPSVLLTPHSLESQQKCQFLRKVFPNFLLYCLIASALFYFNMFQYL